MTAIPAKRLLGWLWRDHIAKRWLLLACALLLMAVEGAATGGLSYLVRPMFDEVHRLCEAAEGRKVQMASLERFAFYAAAGRVPAPDAHGCCTGGCPRSNRARWGHRRVGASGSA